MRLVLAPLCGVLLVAGCSSVPMQPVEKIATRCDLSLMDRIEGARQPILVERYWVHCPEVHVVAKTS